MTACQLFLCSPPACDGRAISLVTLCPNVQHTVGNLHVQMTLPQQGFELHRSTYKRIFYSMVIVIFFKEYFLFF